MTPITMLNFFFILVNSAQYDNPLDHYDWRKRVASINHIVVWMWMAYVNVLIKRQNFDQIFVLHHVKIETLNIEFVLETIQNDKLAELITGRYKKLLEPAGLYHQLSFVVKCLHFSLHLQSAEQLQLPNLIRDTQTVTTWLFLLHKKLRLGITVEKLVNYRTFHEDRCKSNVTILSSDDWGSSERFVLCGIYSHFLYFSHGHRIQFTLSYVFFSGNYCVQHNLMSPQGMSYLMLE